MPFKAFVSSTFKDLQAHRQQVLAAVRTSGFMVDPMEDWTADRHTPTFISQQRVEGCDLCVLLVAYRRGHVAGGEQDSITQLEYQAAVRLGLDILVFMLKDGADWPPEHTDLLTDPQLVAWRHTLLEEHTVAFFDTDPASIPVYPALNRWLQEKLASLQSSGDLQITLQKAIQLMQQQQTAVVAPPPVSRAQLALARFVVRPEYFGCLIYDRINDDYIAFDQEACQLFKLARNTHLPDVYSHFTNRHESQSLETFVQLCQNVGLLDANSRFTGLFLNQDGSVPDQLSAPVRVHLTLTTACNLQCSHCYLSAGSASPGELDSKDIVTLLDEMTELGCYQLTLGGGEPLLLPHLPEVLDHANACGISVTLASNASAVSPERVKQLGRYRISAFRISMDAANAELYDALRGQTGAFTAAMQGIAQLRSLGVPIELHTVLMAPNRHELPALVQLAEQVGASKLTLSTLKPAGRAAHQPELLPDRAMINRAWQQLTELQAHTRIPLEINGQVPADKKWLFSGFGCNCGNLVCHIDARGRVSPNGFLSHLASASIRHFSLKQIWDADAGLQSFRHLPGNPVCRACEHFPGCRGGCRASALLTLQSLEAPDTACELAWPDKTPVSLIALT